MTDGRKVPVDSVDPFPFESGEDGLTAEQAAQALLDSEAPDEGTPEDESEAVEAADEAEETEVPEDEDDLEDEFEDEEEDDEEDEEPEEDLYTVRVDGEEVQVTLDELLSGYSRTADYTRKTQKLSERQKELEEVEGDLRTARDEYAERLDIATRYLEEIKPQEPDWERLAEQDPREFNRQLVKHREYERQKAALEAEQQRVAQERHADQMRQLEATRERELEALTEKLPELKDPEVREAKMAEMAAYARDTYGFTDEDLGNVYDHRLLVMLDKARRYDELQQKGGRKLKSKAKKAKVLEPGGKTASSATPKKRQKQAQRAMEQLAQSGRVNDAAAVFELLEG